MKGRSGGRGTAKVFKTGGSKAVRIPGSFDVEEGEVYIEQVGWSIVITPKDKVKENLYLAMSLIPDDFMADEYPLDETEESK